MIALRVSGRGRCLFRDGFGACSRRQLMDESPGLGETRASRWVLLADVRNGSFSCSWDRFETCPTGDAAQPRWRERESAIRRNRCPAVGAAATGSSPYLLLYQ